MIELDEKYVEIARGACNTTYEDICKYDVYGLQMIDGPVRRVLDIGAHVGTTSAACRKLWPTAEIICVEPPTGNQPTLARMLDGQNITLVTGAFGPDGEDLYHCGSDDPTFVSGAHGFLASNAWTTPAGHADTTNVGAIGMSLPTLLKKFKSSAAGLIVKIDCEGGEWPMIRDRDSDAAVRSVDYMPLEIHTFLGSMTGVTYDEMVGWAARFAATHEPLMPAKSAIGAGGFLMGLVKKGFVSSDRVQQLKQHYANQVDGIIPR